MKWFVSSFFLFFFNTVTWHFSLMWDTESSMQFSGCGLEPQSHKVKQLLYSDVHYFLFSIWHSEAAEVGWYLQIWSTDNSVLFCSKYRELFIGIDSSHKLSALSLSLLTVCPIALTRQRLLVCQTNHLFTCVYSHKELSDWPDKTLIVL